MFCLNSLKSHGVHPQHVPKDKITGLVQEVFLFYFDSEQTEWPPKLPWHEICLASVWCMHSAEERSFSNTLSSFNLNFPVFVWRLNQPVFIRSQAATSVGVSETRRRWPLLFCHGASAAVMFQEKLHGWCLTVKTILLVPQISSHPLLCTAVLTLLRKAVSANGIPGIVLQSCAKQLTGVFTFLICRWFCQLFLQVWKQLLLFLLQSGL